MTVKHTFYNSTDSQVVMDDEGRILGGREHGDYEPTEQTERAVSLGDLLDQGEVEEQKESETEPPKGKGRSKAAGSDKSTSDAVEQSQAEDGQ